MRRVSGLAAWLFATNVSLALGAGPWNAAVVSPAAFRIWTPSGTISGDSGRLVAWKEGDLARATPAEGDARFEFDDPAVAAFRAIEERLDGDPRIGEIRWRGVLVQDRVEEMRALAGMGRFLVLRTDEAQLVANPGPAHGYRLALTVRARLVKMPWGVEIWSAAHTATDTDESPPTLERLRDNGGEPLRRLLDGQAAACGQALADDLLRALGRP